MKKNLFVVKEWFKNIQNKKNKIFIRFDIETFYASITPKNYEQIFRLGSFFVKH